LKDPPKDYEYPGFDVVGHLESVRRKLVADAYPNEIKFQEDLFTMTAKVHDGHFVFYPDALTRVFGYGRKIGLVSYSENTTATPVIKIFGMFLIDFGPCVRSL
jgi:hypothetical protein